MIQFLAGHCSGTQLRTKDRLPKKKIVAIACHGANVDQSLSAQVLSFLGRADVTLRSEHGDQLPSELRRALTSSKEKQPRESEISVEQALSEVVSDLSSLNWILLEPTRLDLHHAGCGGLGELKEWLPNDKVMFGVLRFSFPRSDCAPPIVKYVFLHWIGPKVSVVRRGQWNSKLEQASSKMRTMCDFAFRKTAYDVADLVLTNLIDELARVTCITSSDTRQLSVDWYMEGLSAGVQAIESQLSSTTPSCTFAAAQEKQPQHNSTMIPFLRESAQHAINMVHEEGRQWKWVLFTMTEYNVPSSGGA